MTEPTPLDAALLRTLPLPRPEEGSKEERGHVAVVGGSMEVPGALLLAAAGALRAGAGKLKMATVADLAPLLAVTMPEALVIGLERTAAGGISATAAPGLTDRLKGCDAVLIGPGMTEEPDADAFVAALAEGLADTDLVLDAAALCGLTALGDTLRRGRGSAILTPHAGEMAHMLGRNREAVEADPLGTAREAAERLGAVVVMKGARTHVVAPDGRAWLYGGGGVGLATSGSGDTLAGIIIGILGRGMPAEVAALWGVFLHGQAGARLMHRIGPLGFLAREIPAEVPAIMAEFDPDVAT